MKEIMKSAIAVFVAITVVLLFTIGVPEGINYLSDRYNCRKYAESISAKNWFQEIGGECYIDGVRKYTKEAEIEVKTMIDNTKGDTTHARNNSL